MLDMEIVIRPLAVCNTPPPHRVLHFRVELGIFIQNVKRDILDKCIGLEKTS